MKRIKQLRSIFLLITVFAFVPNSVSCQSTIPDEGEKLQFTAVIPCEGFRRPKTDTYLTHLYSFLENFYTETGNVERRGLYSNQWIYNTENQWIELTKIKFTADATARRESRMDYAGGVEKGSFFLKNCGFFNETTPIDSYFERLPSGISPSINFEELP